MKRVVAICGKGGAGKTTTSALLLRAVASVRPGWRVLAVDADPAAGLSLALNMPAERTLDRLRRELAEAVVKANQPAEELAAGATYRLMQIIEERQQLAFLAVGRPEEQGCYCKLNSFLRGAVEALSSRFDLTLIDAEAGVEQVNRRVMRSVTDLLLVSDPTRKGINVVNQLAAVAESTMSPRRVGLLLNRVADPTLTEPLAQACAAPLRLVIPHDPAVARFDAEGKDFIAMPRGPAADAVQSWVEAWADGIERNTFNNKQL